MPLEKYPLEEYPLEEYLDEAREEYEKLLLLEELKRWDVELELPERLEADEELPERLDAEDELPERLEVLEELLPLVEEEEVVPHLEEQTGNESEQEGPLRQVLVVPSVTQQYPENDDVEEEEPKEQFA